jgi:hypothetical protein
MNTMKHTTKLRRGEPVLAREPKPKAVKVEKPSISKKVPIPKGFRRIKRARKNKDAKYRPDGKLLGTGRIMGVNWDSGAVYSPQRKKLKGWQRENRKYRKVS